MSKFLTIRRRGLPQPITLHIDKIISIEPTESENWAYITVESGKATLTYTAEHSYAAVLDAIARPIYVADLTQPGREMP